MFLTRHQTSSHLQTVGFHSLEGVNKMQSERCVSIFFILGGRLKIETKQRKPFGPSDDPYFYGIPSKQKQLFVHLKQSSWVSQVEWGGGGGSSV